MSIQFYQMLSNALQSNVPICTLLNNVKNIPSLIAPHPHQYLKPQKFSNCVQLFCGSISNILELLEWVISIFVYTTCFRVTMEMIKQRYNSNPRSGWGTKCQRTPPIWFQTEFLLPKPYIPWFHSTSTPITLSLRIYWSGSRIFILP